MPEITREEAKRSIAKWIEQHVFARDVFVGREAFHDRYEVILRLALAALEDAERVEWLEARYGWSIGRSPEGALPGVSLYLPPKPSCPIDATTVRAAIDRARGADRDT